jgi:hypothetical protein
LDCIVVGYPIIGIGLSAFNYRIIHIRRISLTPYPNPHPHTIGFELSTSAWASKALLHIRIIRIQIRIGSDAEIIHTTFIPSSRDPCPEQAEVGSACPCAAEQAGGAPLVAFVDGGRALATATGAPAPQQRRRWPPRPELRPPRATNVGGRRGGRCRCFRPANLPRGYPR